MSKQRESDAAAIAFTPSARRTLGVEWELGLVDATSLELVPVAPAVLERAGELEHTGDLHGLIRPGVHKSRSTLTTELLRNTVEIVTGICDNAAEAAGDLHEGLDRVQRAAAESGVLLFGGGSHPMARGEEQEVSAGERYATLIDRTAWWGRQMVIYGVHVHVGVTSAAKVWPLLGGLLTYHPHLTALSASSPYWAGSDTGYASNRTMLFQQLPTAGLPFQFDSWSSYQGYLRDVFTTGVVEDVSELRWDIRPSPKLGTIEVRACDAVNSVEEVSAIAALVHCLVVHLESTLDAGLLPVALPPWHVQENKWRAARYGLEAEVILGADSREGMVVDDLYRLLNELEPVAATLGCTNELAGVETILRQGAGYQRQRAAVAAAGGDVRAAARAMVVPAVSSAPS